MKPDIRYHTEEMQVVLLDSLEKVFEGQAPMPIELNNKVLQNDRLSMQLVCSRVTQEPPKRWDMTKFVKVEVDSPIADYITIRSVGQVPCRYIAHPGADDNYLCKEAGLYPDCLWPVKNSVFPLSLNVWQSLWIDIEVPKEVRAGEYPLVFRLADAQTADPLCEVTTSVAVLPFTLPEQTFPRTDWFYADCLADAYGVEVFSEEHWAIMRRFIEAAVRRGSNMILTPQFTPPLDTAVGWERTTVQLVDVEKTDDGWIFDFSKLRRWIEMCLDVGVKYFEMSHLFSQWGAVAAPKVMGRDGDKVHRVFGWDTPADGEYAKFLQTYLPQLRSVLKECDIEDRTYFHISDEPHLTQVDSYRTAMESVREALDSCHIMDALSDYDFYKLGLVEIPVCAADHIKPFLEKGAEHLWCYYCTAQSNDVSNRFIGQSAARTRLYGAQLYKFNIEGSLHWGYNFYNTAYSYERIDPFLINDAGYSVPAGDPFIVYPGLDREPLESIRMMLMDDAIRDLRALRALEQKIGREKTLAIVEEGLDKPLAFDTYPSTPDDAVWLRRMRMRVNEALVK